MDIQKTISYLQSSIDRRGNNISETNKCIEIAKEYIKELKQDGNTYILKHWQYELKEDKLWLDKLTESQN